MLSEEEPRVDNPSFPSTLAAWHLLGAEDSTPEESET